MADDDDTREGMAGRGRFVYGPRPIGNLVPTVTRPVYKRQNPSAAQILADWEVIVGPKVASMTIPRRLDRGVLTIACAGPTAMELHYVGVAMINRINTHLGGQPVHSLKFTQAGMPRKAAPIHKKPPEAILEAQAAVADLPDGELKDALAALGRVVIGRSKHSTRPLKKL
ncbi:MAG TPA: DUF721 domain-containing protein [Acetobacteraceae bacterium]|jgi:hypothetical protein|nr:DUF721 domain-containing protein [Acetobacteraceae bacterium]